MQNYDFSIVKEGFTYQYKDMRMKTIEQIQSLKKILLDELNRLPENNVFGDNNDLDRERLHGWIIDLTYIEKFGAPGDWHSDVGFWFTEESWSPLTDYEQFNEDFTEYERLLRYAAWLNM